MTQHRVGVAGATGALGKEIVRVLDQSKWRPDRLVALASRATNVGQVEYGEERVPVDDLELEVLDDLDALFLALPRDLAAEFGGRALEGGVPVVDCSGAFDEDEDVRLVIPWVNPEVLAEPSARDVLAVPGPVATLLASVLGPLRRAGIAGPTSAVVLVPASFAGRDGIEELSKQVVALFNAADPPRKVFPNGLAFDLVPQWGELEPTGWTRDETRAAAQVSRLTGVEPPTVTLVGVPVFSGVSAHLSIDASQAAPPELVRRILADGGVHVEEDDRPRLVPRPRRVEGRPLVHAGRVRVDSAGGLHLWVAMDNLAVTAAVAVACGGLLLGHRGRG